RGPRLSKMKPHVCPTITAVSRKEYLEQLNLLTKFAPRIHIDISDGTLAPRELLGLGSMRWPQKTTTDIHVMSRHPHAELAIAAELKPHLVIVHAEAETDLKAVAVALHDKGIKAGLALLPETEVGPLSDLISYYFDHVLIFSGNLGYQGGSLADLSLLDKVQTLKQLKASIEIGWDGGINDQNISIIAESGVSVINVGGYISRSKSPKAAYAKLRTALRSVNNHAPSPFS
ncbi:MAG: ribulose-phosphate 3-epimerase, partial [Candidatus Saccharimonadales bacterium]